MEISDIDRDELIAAFAKAINIQSRENGSNTPDYILARYLEGCLQAFEVALAGRTRWYGNSVDSIDAAEER